MLPDPSTVPPWYQTTTTHFITLHSIKNHSSSYLITQPFMSHCVMCACWLTDTDCHRVWFLLCLTLFYGMTLFMQLSWPGLPGRRDLNGTFLVKHEIGLYLKMYIKNYYLLQYYENNAASWAKHFLSFILLFLHTGPLTALSRLGTTSSERTPPSQYPFVSPFVRPAYAVCSEKGTRTMIPVSRHTPLPQYVCGTMSP